MVTDKGILYGTCKALSEAFPKAVILTKHNKVEVEKDHFFVEVTPLTTTPYRLYEFERAVIDIKYIAKINQTQEEMFDMKQDINKAIGMFVKVNRDEYILVDNKKWSTTDTLGVSFETEFKTGDDDTKYWNNKYSALMEDLNINGEEIED